MLLNKFGAAILEQGGSMTSAKNEQSVEWLSLVAGTNLMETSKQQLLGCLEDCSSSGLSHACWSQEFFPFIYLFIFFGNQSIWQAEQTKNWLFFLTLKSVFLDFLPFFFFF